MNLKSRRHQRCPQRLRSRERHLLGKRRELLGLLGQCRKLLLCMLGRKFDELRRRLYARHPLGKVEGGLGVGVSNLKQLVIVILHPFKCRRIAMLHNVGRLPGGRAHFVKTSLDCATPFSAISRNCSGASVFDFALGFVSIRNFLCCCPQLAEPSRRHWDLLGS